MVAPPISSFRVLVALVVCVSLAPELSAAQPSTPDSSAADTTGVQWHTMLPTLTVTASRIPAAPSEAPAHVTVLDSAALHGGGATSVASVLESRAGLYVRRYGAGGLATPAMRGTGASQTVLLLDGQRINDPQLGHLDLSLLPAVLLQSVAVMHGPASPIHGSDGLGGAVHLRSLQPRGALQTRVTSRVGAFGQRGASMLVGGATAPKTSVVVAGEYQTTDGDFPYTDSRQFPPQTVRRQNGDRRRSTVYASVRSEHGGHSLRLSGWMTRAERGLPSPGTGRRADERQWDEQLRLWGSDRIRLEKGTLSLQGLAQRTRLRYKNAAQNIDQTGRTDLATLDATLRHNLSPRWTIATGTSGSLAHARHPKLAAPGTQHHLAAFGEGTGQYGGFTFYPALRADVYWMPAGAQQTAVSPRLGVNVEPFPDRPGLHVKGQFGRSFRMPTFNDRYWQPGGNPDLRPEQSWGGDVGIRLDRAYGHVEITTFGHWRRDQIVWTPTGAGYWSPENVERVRALGTEVTAAGGWPLSSTAHLKGRLSYSFTDARNRTDPNAATFDEPVLYVPKTQFTSHSTLTWGPAALSFTARYTGRRPINSDGSRFRDGYVLLDAQLQLEHDFDIVRAGLSVRLENALDARYRTVGSRPMPPRHLEVRLHLAR